MVATELTAPKAERVPPEPMVNLEARQVKKAAQVVQVAQVVRLEMPEVFYLLLQASQKHLI